MGPVFSSFNLDCQMANTCTKQLTEKGTVFSGFNLDNQVMYHLSISSQPCLSICEKDEMKCQAEINQNIQSVSFLSWHMDESR